MDQRTPFALIRFPLLPLLLPFLLFIGLPVASALAEDRLLEKGWSEEKIAPGLVWKSQQFDSLFDAKQNVHLLYIDPSQYRLGFEVLTDLPATVREIGEDQKAVAAINGSYFDMKTMLSTTFIKHNGALVSRPRSDEPRQRAALVINEAGIADIIRRPESGAWDISSPYPHMLASSPILVTHGKAWDHKNHEYGEACHPRSAVGITAENHVLFVTVDGRAQHAVGMTYTELAKTMVVLGCRKAICLDGGGSTTLWIKGKNVVNTPSTKSLVSRLPIERQVTNAILVFPRSAK